MKKIILAAVLSVFAMSAQASEFDYNDFCLQMSRVAESTMKLRQYNMPIADLIKANNEQVKEDGWFKDILMLYTKEAYARPLRLSEEVKEIEINEFATKKYFDCLETYE